MGEGPRALFARLGLAKKSPAPDIGATSTSRGTRGFAQISPPGKPRRLLQAVRYAFPQRHAIGIIVALMLTVAAVNAIEPLIIKAVFDELTAGQREHFLVLSIATL